MRFLALFVFSVALYAQNQPGFGGNSARHFYVGGHQAYFPDASLSVFSDTPQGENQWGFTVQNDGNGYAHQGYWLFNSTNGVRQDLFYTGAQAILNGSSIWDKVYYIESVSGSTYANELAIRPHLMTVRRDGAFCWSDVDDAGGIGLSMVIAPDLCLRHPAPGVLAIETGQAGTSATVKAENVIAGNLQLAPSTAEPSCDATIPGKFWYTAGGTGVKDKVEVCAKAADDSWAWRAVY